MPSTFGSFVVYEDEKGVHICHNPPRNLGECEAERKQYAGPRVIMPETVPNLNKWMADRRKEGFTFSKGKVKT